MSNASARVVAGPREFLTTNGAYSPFDDVYVEVSIVRDADTYMARIRRYEETPDGRKFIRLGDIDLDEMAEIHEIYYDLIKELGLA